MRGRVVLTALGQKAPVDHLRHRALEGAFHAAAEERHARLNRLARQHKFAVVDQGLGQVQVDLRRVVWRHTVGAAAEDIAGMGKQTQSFRTCLVPIMHGGEHATQVDLDDGCIQVRLAAGVAEEAQGVAKLALALALGDCEPESLSFMPAHHAQRRPRRRCKCSP